MSNDITPADALGGVRLCPHEGYAYTWIKCWPHEDATLIALPLARAQAVAMVVGAAKPAADWLESGCYCPCCGQRDECVNDCTYADDAPAEWARMVAVREVAAPLIKALSALERGRGEG